MQEAPSAGTRSGNCLAQAAEDDIGQHLADEMARGHRCGRQSIDDGVGRRADMIGRERAGIVGHPGRDGAGEAEDRIGGGIGERAVDAEARGRRGAGEIDLDLAVGDRGGGGQRERLVIAVDGHLIAPAAARQLGDLRQDRRARALEDMAGEILQCGEAELGHHLAEAPGADLVAVDQGIDVALGLHGQAGIGLDDRHQGLVHPAAIDQLQEGQREPLHEDIGAVGPEADPAEIDDMAGAGEEPDEPAVMKGRGGDDEIVQMPGPLPGIVGAIDIALRHGLRREGLDEMAHRFRHGIHMARRAGHGLGQHIALEIEDSRREVAGLAHDGAEGRAQQSLGLLLDHGEQPVPHDLAPDGGKAAGCVGHGDVSAR